MNPKVLTDMQRTAVALKLYYPTRPHQVRADHFEKDRRSQPKAIREAVEKGYLAQEQAKDGYLTVTDKPYKMTPAQPLNITEAWDKQRQRMTRNKDRVFVKVGGFFAPVMPTENIKYLLENADKYEWYLASSHSLSFDNPLTDDQMKGPYTLPQMQEEYEKYAAVGMQEKWEAVVCNDELKRHAKATIFQEKLKHYYPLAIGWFFRDAGVLTEEESKLFKDDDYSSPIGLLVGGGGTGKVFLGEDPLLWDAALGDKIDAAVYQIELHLKRVAVLRKVEKAVREMGGWDTFRSKYNDKLIAALQEKEAEKPEEKT